VPAEPHRCRHRLHAHADTNAEREPEPHAIADPERIADAAAAPEHAAEHEHELRLMGDTEEVPEWMKVSPALKRMAEARVPDQFRRCRICGHRHMFLPGCSETCGCTREVLE